MMYTIKRLKENASEYHPVNFKNPQPTRICLEMGIHLRLEVYDLDSQFDSVRTISTETYTTVMSRRT